MLLAKEKISKDDYQFAGLKNNIFLSESLGVEEIDQEWTVIERRTSKRSRRP